MAKIPLTQFLTPAPYGCDPEATWTNQGDCAYQPGEVRWLILIDRAYTFTDIADPNEWAGAVTTGDIILIPCAGKLNKPEPTIITGKGGRMEKVAELKHTFSLTIDNPDGNMKLIKKLINNPTQFGYCFVYKDYRSYAAMTDGGEDYEFVNVVAGYLNETKEREWFVDGSWSNLEMPYIFDVPISILPA